LDGRFGAVRSIPCEPGANRVVVMQHSQRFHSATCWLSRLHVCLIVVFSVLASCRFLSSQTFYFGKNKIQYVDFDWHILKGEHVDVYFYPEEREIAEVALKEAESSYRFLEEKFRHHVFRRIPLILYSSHQDFEQTNVIPYFVPEGVGGVTELLKGRVALPFSGSYHDFKTVIRHEMVHVFETGKINSYRMMRKGYQAVYSPLWVTEGLAEYLSGEWNTLGDQVMRDLVMHHRLSDIGDLWHFNGTFAVYKIGQSIFRFLGERYGDDKISLLYEEMGRGSTFPAAFRRTYGTTLEDVGSEWNWWLKQRYYPEVARFTDLGVRAEKLTRGGSSFHPVIFKDGEGINRLVYISTRSGYEDICEISMDDEKTPEKTILRGGRGALLESLHPFQSGIDVSEAGILVFSSKYHDRDALVFLDLDTGKITGRYQFEGIVGITSPAWSPGGDRVVFSGLTPAGYLDLFVFHLGDGRLEQLTNDRYADRDPDFSPGGDRVVFSSDRTPYGKGGALNLCTIDISSREIRYLMLGPWRDESPEWRSGRDGEILFVSDRDGIQNAYSLGEGGRVERLTSFSSGVYSPRWLPDKKGLVFAAMDDQSFGIYRMDRLERPDTVSVVPAVEKGVHSWGWELPVNDSSRVERVERYRRKFSLDIAQGGVGFSSSFGNAQGAQFVLSDMLSDQLVALQVFNTASSSKDFLGSFSGSATYINRKERLNYGWGAYHFKGDFFDFRRSDTPFSERQYGAFFLLGYPFSKFLRVEGSILVSRSDRSDYISNFSRKSYLVTNVFSLVKDNSLWLPTGPIDGERINLTIGITNDISRASTDNMTLQADIRKYFRTSLRSAYAVRLFGRISEGTLPERAFIGGSWTLRGYPRFSILGTRVVLINQELRFPLLNRLILRFPFGDLSSPPIQGALFFDAGNAWDKDAGYPGLLGSFGLGARFSLGGPLVLRLDLARTTDFHSISHDTKVDFFFGYDY